MGNILVCKYFCATSVDSWYRSPLPGRAASPLPVGPKFYYLYATELKMFKINYSIMTSVTIIIDISKNLKSHITCHITLITE